MPAWNDLCLLQDVKNWIMGDPASNQWPTNSDAMLGFEISAASRGLLRFLQRPTLLYHGVDEIRSGVGGRRLMLRQWPLLAVSSLKINGSSITARPALGQPSTSSFPGAGWVVENPWDMIGPGAPAMLLVDGYSYCEGEANIEIKYTAGYVVQNEAAVVPTGSFQIQPIAPYGRFAQDVGVTYANGTALTPVSANPLQGQYVAPALPPATTSNSNYTPQYLFNSADALASVLLSYSFTPFEIQQACTKWVGEWWAYRKRPGQKSQSGPAGGGSSTYDLSDMPADIKLMLSPYRTVVPISR